MIVLPNYLVPRGRPEVFPFDVILCHPDDRAELVAEAETVDRLRAELIDGYEEAQARWSEFLRRRDEA